MRKKKTTLDESGHAKNARLPYCSQRAAAAVKLGSACAVVEKTTTRVWFSCLIGISVLSLITRLYNLHQPASVCWDETHFGKMASSYINGSLFFDVHPPLGKMLIALGGVIAGYDGSFSFEKIGDEYPDSVPYVALRLFCAVFGIALAPLCYCTVHRLAGSCFASVLAACLIVFDTGFLTLSQYILLDPFLLLFISAAAQCYVEFTAVADRVFSCKWWFWLTVTGICLALAISVKFVGLFVMLLIGVSTIAELWQLLGNLSIPMPCHPQLLHCSMWEWVYDMYLRSFDQ